MRKIGRALLALALVAAAAVAFAPSAMASDGGYCGHKMAGHA